jgi:ketosteroid isomerase-like protein
LLLILIGILLASCGPTQPKDPIAVVQAAYERLNERDVAGYLEYFSEQAVMVDPTDLQMDGKNAIREYVENELLTSNLRFELSDLQADGNTVTYTVKAFHYTTEVDSQSDTLDVVVDGKILFEGSLESFHEYCNKDPARAFCK